MFKRTLASVITGALLFGAVVPAMAQISDSEELTLKASMIEARERLANAQTAVDDIVIGKL